MSGRRAIFLDVDGTYAHLGEVPEAHADAVGRARTAGHLVLLCTGRPLSLLPPRILAAGFDGVVATAGAYVEVGGQVLADRELEPEIAERLVRALESHGARYVLEATGGLYGTPATQRALLERVERHRAATDGTAHAGPFDIMDVLTVRESVIGVGFAKVAVVDSPVPVEDIARAAGEEVAALESSIPGMGASSGELYRRGVHKAVGVRVVVEHLGLDMADTLGFGDGMNDVEMLAEVGTGVAIDGSDPRVVAAADRTAAGPHASGLVAAFEELGLI